MLIASLFFSVLTFNLLKNILVGKRKKERKENAFLFKKMTPFSQFFFHYVHDSYAIIHLLILISF